MTHTILGSSQNSNMKPPLTSENHFSLAAQNPLNRRRNRRRQRIVEAANELFEANGGEIGGGYETTTVEQIAERADISVRTFFRYFKSKADAIYLDLEAAKRDYFSMVEARLQQGEAVFDACLNARYDQVRSFCEEKEDRARMMNAFRSATFLERNAILRADWRRQLEELLIASSRSQLTSIQAATLASLCLDLTSAALETWAKKPKSAQPHDLAMEAFLAARTILNGWSEPKPRSARGKVARID